MRTSEAQKNADSAPAHDIVISPPSSGRQPAARPRATAGTAGRRGGCRGRASGRACTSRGWCARRRTSSRCARSQKPLISAGIDLAVAPRRVRIALAVAERVVAAVVGHPADHRPLDRQRAGDRQRDPQRPVGLERAVREQPVVADGDAEPGHDVERPANSTTSVQPSPQPQATGTAARKARNGHDHERVQRDLLAAALGAFEDRLRSGDGGSGVLGRSSTAVMRRYRHGHGRRAACRT